MSAGNRLDPDAERELIEFLDGLESIYIIFHCFVCGIPWKEHSNSCSQDCKKREYRCYCKLAEMIPKYRELFDRARRDGWIGEHVAHFGITGVHQVVTPFLVQFGETVA